MVQAAAWGLPGLELRGVLTRVHCSSEAIFMMTACTDCLHKLLAHTRSLTDRYRLLPAELLNLMYDAMPCDYVTLIITEVGAIPPTSIPVVLREYRTEPKM